MLGKSKFDFKAEEWILKECVITPIIIIFSILTKINLSFPIDKFQSDNS